MTTANAKKQQSIRTFDKLAENYSPSTYAQCHSGWDDSVLPLVQAARPAALLDVGCGTGAFLERCSALPDVTLAGIDLSAGMMAAVRNRLGPRADVREGDAEALPWADGQFNVIVCIASFHHYPRPGQALAEMRRVLSPKGAVFLADVHMPTPIRQFTNILLPFLKSGDVHMYSELEMRRLSQAADFARMQWRVIAGGGFLCTLEKS